MGIAKGSRAILSYLEEASYDVIAAPWAATGIPFVSETLGESINAITSEELRSDRSVPSSRGGNIASEGNIITDFALTRHYKFLKHLLGNAVMASPVTPAAIVDAVANVRGRYYASNGRWYLCVIGGVCDAGEVATGLSGTVVGVREELGTATFEFIENSGGPNLFNYSILGAEALPAAGLALVKKIRGYGPANDEHFSICYPGSRINALAITIPQEGIVRSDWSFIGKRTSVRKNGDVVEDFTSPADPAFPAPQDPFTGNDVLVTFNPSQIGRPIREATINIANNIDLGVYAVGSRFRREVPEGRRECSGTFTTYFEDSTEYDAFKAETSLDLTFVFTRPGVMMQIRFPAVKLTGQGTPQVSGQGVLTASYSFNVFKSGSDPDVEVTISTAIVV